MTKMFQNKLMHMWITLFALFQIAKSDYYTPSESHALHAFYNATNGPHWKWSTDRNAGRMWDFSDPERNNPCNRLWQGVFCAAASNGCETNPLNCHIFSIELNNFNLSGTLPRNIFSVFTNLTMISVGDNHLFGSLPTLSSLPILTNVNFSHNFFSHAIPDDLIMSPPTETILELLYLSGNQLTGPIPSFVYHLPKLKFLNLYNNQLSNSISNEIGLLRDSIFYINFARNCFTSTLPITLGDLNTVEYLYLYGNRFSGSLLPLAPLTTLRELWISSNLFSKYFPPELCNNHKIRMIAIYDNALSSTLPECLSTLSDLEVFQVQQNELKGDNLQNVFNPTIQTRLEFVDLSDNAFSSQFPSNIFHLPSLKSIAAVKNCFEGSIPSTICESSRYLSVIALDGMRLSPKCMNYIWDPFKISVGSYSPLMTGTIPDCIWSLPNISVVHLAGNGYSGTLPNVIPEHVLGYGAGKCTLRDLNLANNKLFGTIPRAIQSIPFTNLDLSFNKLYGSIDHIINVPLSNDSNSYDGATINLEENRLSGSVPSTWHDAYNLNVLNGNLFACMRRDDLPTHDPHFETYICGSSEYNEALQSFGYVLSILLLTLGILIILVTFYRPQMILGAQNNTNEKQILKNHRLEKSDAFVSKTIEALIYTAEFCGHIYDFDRYLCHQKLNRLQEGQIAKNERRTQLNEIKDSTRLSELSRLSKTSLSESEFGDGQLMASDTRISVLTEHSHSVYDEAEKERMIRYRNAFQFLSALSLIRSAAVMIALYALCICLPVYVLFYIADSDSTRYSSHYQRYGWITTSVFITGTLPAAILLLIWTVLVVLMMIKFIVHFNLHTLESTRLMKLFDFLLLKRNGNDHSEDSCGSKGNSSKDQRVSINQSSARIDFNGPSLFTNKNISPMVANRKVENNIGPSATYSSIPGCEIHNHLDHSDQDMVDTPPSKSTQNNSFSFRATNISFWPSFNDPESSMKFHDTEELSISSKAMEVLVANEERKSKLRFWSLYVSIFILNTAICIVINIAYLYIQNASSITSDFKGLMQVFMAGFKIFWNLVAIRIMIAWLPYNKHSVKLHVFLLVFNSILAPCIATAFTDEACFANFFQGNDVICTSYHITTCLESYQMVDPTTKECQTVCTNYADVSYVTEITPSFIYYYTCGSKLLTAYIPVYLYTYTILLFSGPLVCTLFAAWYQRYFPTFLLKRIDAVLRPGDRGIVLFDRLIRAVSIQALLTQHIVVLLTFGVCCPLLALVMALAISADCFMWQVVITRYIKYETETVPFSPKYKVKETVGSQLIAHLKDWVTSCYCSMICLKKSIDRGSRSSNSDNEGPNDEMDSTTSPLLDGDIKECTTSAAEKGRRSIFLQERKSQLLDFQFKSKEEFIASQQKEDARLFELHTLIGDAWMCVRNAMWLVFYCSMLFYAFVLFDMVGDKGGWQRAIYLVVVVFLSILLIRVLLMDVTIYFHSWFSHEGNEEDCEESAFNYRFSSFYYHTRNQQKKRGLQPNHSHLRLSGLGLGKEREREEFNYCCAGLNEAEHPTASFIIKDDQLAKTKSIRGNSEGSGDSKL